MKARLGDTVIAEADQGDLVRIEGNWYFPPQSVSQEFLHDSDTPYTCPWKGEAQYYDVKVDNQVLADRAWAYPTPYATAIDRVGQDFSGYIAFWKEVEVVD